VYVSVRDQPGRREHGGGSGGRTDANDEGADGEAGDGVFDQVRRAGSQQGGGGAHAGVIVGRLEGFAADVRTDVGVMYEALTIPWWRRVESRRGESSVKRRNPIRGVGRGGGGDGRAGLGTSIHQAPSTNRSRPTQTVLTHTTLDARRSTLCCLHLS
jgi:hypothetical protein